MRLASVCFLLAFSGLLQAADPATPNWMVGSWQFGDRWVWIKIDPDGTALQCRIAPGGTIYKSAGRYIAPQSIHWEAIWETDKVTRQEDQISLSGKWGAFAYHHADVGMSPKCFDSNVSNSP